MCLKIGAASLPRTCSAPRRTAACFAVCPEYAINIALQGGRDGTFEFSIERA